MIHLCECRMWAQCPHSECRDVHSWAAAVALLVMEGQEIIKILSTSGAHGCIGYLRYLLCCQEYLVDLANLCLPFHPAHQEVQSGQLALGDPVG